uniref:Uncharacterized protein n=1 Tax=Arundo donax TaxID=35708 RepID=A0A0A8YDC0_ARUDO
MGELEIVVLSHRCRSTSPLPHQWHGRGSTPAASQGGSEDEQGAGAAPAPTPAVTHGGFEVKVRDNGSARPQHRLRRRARP